ncbi:MAG: hypothetical protein ACW991_10110, partial [Candidatus Hodarchaeales archaeon]
ITIVVRSLSPQSLSMPTALTIAIGLSGGIIFLLFTIVYVIKRPNITEATRADSKIKRRMR